MSENKLHDLLTDKNQGFSTISGIPCLYTDKETTLADWSQKISSFFSEEEINIKHLQHQINNEKSEKTKKRLNDTLQGRSANLKQMKKILTAHGLKRLEAAGQEFDPTVHQAIQKEETKDVKKAMVKEEFMPGYKLYQQLLRAAIVSVSIPKEEEEA